MEMWCVALQRNNVASGDPLPKAEGLRAEEVIHLSCADAPWVRSRVGMVMWHANVMNKAPRDRLPEVQVLRAGRRGDQPELCRSSLGRTQGRYWGSGAAWQCGNVAPGDRLFKTKKVPEQGGEVINPSAANASWEVSRFGAWGGSVGLCHPRPMAPWVGAIGGPTPPLSLVRGPIF